MNETIAIITGVENVSEVQSLLSTTNDNCLFSNYCKNLKIHSPHFSLNV